MSSQSKTDGSNALKDRRIIVIEATQKQEQKKLRVAGYARVSSDSGDQLNSFAAQNTYFTKLIESNDQWEMVDVYADEGISGRSAEKRGDFQRMIADCERGKIDRIITKSISRFARNAKECLTIIRHLKSIGVSIYFEEQNIDTSIVTGEMLTAVFAGLAQAESESIGKNMRWSYEKRMASGEFNTCKSPLGYRMVKGQLEIDEDEAAIVRMIFRDYLFGKSCEAIGAKLREMGVQSRDGKNAWRPTAIYVEIIHPNSILVSGVGGGQTIIFSEGIKKIQPFAILSWSGFASFYFPKSIEYIATNAYDDGNNSAWVDEVYFMGDKVPNGAEDFLNTIYFNKVYFDYAERDDLCFGRAEGERFDCHVPSEDLAAFLALIRDGKLDEAADPENYVRISEPEEQPTQTQPPATPQTEDGETEAIQEKRSPTIALSAVLAIVAIAEGWLCSSGLDCTGLHRQLHLQYPRCQRSQYRLHRCSYHLRRQGRWNAGNSGTL